MKITFSRDWIFILIFSIYVGTGPVYWIPWVSVEIVNAFKIALFAIIVTWTVIFSFASGRMYFAGGKNVFILIIFFILLSVPGILNGVLEESLYKLQNEVQIFLFLLSCGYLIKRNIIQTVARFSVYVFTVSCLFSLALIYLMPDYISNLNENVTISQAGLGGSRTSWSPAIALYLPWLYIGNYFLGYFSWLAIFLLIANQVIVAGRTGMVSALISFLIFGVIRKNLKIFLFVSLATMLVMYLVFNNLELLRFDTGGIGNRADLDALSTGRIDMYFDALREVSKNPFFGVGVGVGDLFFVHNVILRAAVEGGIPYALSLFGILTLAVSRGWVNIRKSNWLILPAFLTVISGISNSFFEPVAMLGSFNNSVFWWLCFAICVDVDYKKNVLSTMPSKFVNA
jgi:O-antigen ligase